MLFKSIYNEKLKVIAVNPKYDNRNKDLES